jgi:hypothetical protein
LIERVAKAAEAIQSLAQGFKPSEKQGPSVIQVPEKENALQRLNYALRSRSNGSVGITK